MGNKFEFEVEMRVELPLSNEQKEEMRLEQINNANFDIEDYLDEHARYVYKPITIDMNEVGPYSMLDDNHTRIPMKDVGLVIIARIPYRTFQNIREATLSIQTRRASDYITIPQKTKRFEKDY